MSQNRRSFLGSLVAAAGALASGDAAATARAASRAALPPGLQLYTVRGEMQRDLAGTLARVAETGYREVEFAGYFGRPPAEIRALLEQHRLRSPSTHIGYDQLNGAWDAVLRSAVEIGHTYVTVPSLPGSLRSSIAGLRTIAAAFNRGAAEAKTAGVRFAFHNHNVELRPLDGTLPLRVLIEETDPELVSFQLDVYWAFRAGQDPVALLAQHPRRFTMLHLKDSAGPPEHRMVDLGAGVIDFPAILARGSAQELRHIFVEHDQPANPLAFMRTGFAYLASLQH